MNLEQLYIIDIINKKGSLTGAAKEMSKSPSALSLNLKNLEEEWGVQIFDRSQYRLKLTREGDEILKRVKKVLLETENLETYIKTLGNGPEASIRISIDKIFPFHKIENLIKQFKEKFPNTHLYISVEGRTLPYDKINAKEIDFAITYKRKTKDEFLEKMPLSIVNMIAIASPDLISTSQIKIKELESMTQIIVGEFKKEDIGKDGIQKGESKWSVTDLATKKSLIVQGLGYGYMPMYLIEKELIAGKVIEIKSMQKGGAEFCLVRNIQMPMGPAKSFIWESIRDMNKQ